MTDMLYNLRIRARKEGQGAEQATKAVEQVGKTAQATSAQVKQAARGQAQAWQQAKQGATAAGAAVKQVGGAYQRTAAQGQRATDRLRQGMRDDQREIKRTGDAVDSLGERIRRALRRVGDSGGVFRIMGRTAVREVGHITRALGTMQGRLASLGLGLAVGREIANSATLDRSLIRTRQTAGMTPAQMREWRKELFALSRDNGNSVSSLQAGADTLFASGFGYRTVKASMGAIDRAAAVSGADPATLASAAVVGGNVFDVDLNNPKAVVQMLDKMVVAGRAGRIELENLADVLPVIGKNAKAMNLDLNSSLSLLETASQVEGDPRRAATMVDSGLRFFTNLQYMQEAANGSRIPHLFFNAKGQRRPIEDTLNMLKTRYDKLPSDQARTSFLGRVAGHADQDTRGWLTLMLTGHNLQDYINIKQQTAGASAVVSQDLAENRNSTTAVASRMRNTLREAMDRMSQPINKAIASAGSYLLDDLHLSGGQLIAGAAGTAVAGSIAGRIGKYGLDKLGKYVNGGLDTVKNIAVGRALHDATGVVPVYVTNWNGAPASNSSDPVVAATESKVARETLRRRGARYFSYAAPWVMRASPWLAGLSMTGAEGGDARDARALQAAAAGGDHDAAMKLARMQLGHWWSGTPSATEIEQRAQSLMGTPEQQERYRQLSAAMNQTMPAAATPEQIQQVSNVLASAAQMLQQLLGKPLQIDVRTDVPWLHADLNQRHERDARRGG
jgi:hypothetical protein